MKPGDVYTFFKGRVHPPLLAVNARGPLRGYKICPECQQPILKKGQQRKHPDDYRHAKGCPLDGSSR